MNPFHTATAYAGTSVFLTGHTGFKGSWLSFWLQEAGAHVHGYALPPHTSPSLFELAQLENRLASSTFADIRDFSTVLQTMQAAQPDIIFHLAAQPLVRASYRQPVETWASNVMGTVHVLEAARHCPSVKAVVVVTTDKCYENKEWLWGYRESDPLGGHDPYSASKAGAELVVSSYRKSFFQEDNAPLIASARAGNVIGMGDWSEDRLIPDAARAVQAQQTLTIRHPQATRPWQHVLESLHGYLKLGLRLLEGDRGCAESFNFGPHIQDNQPVDYILKILHSHWKELVWQVDNPLHAPHEAHFLYLDSSKSKSILNWMPHWTLEEALRHTAQGYRAVSAVPYSAYDVMKAQLEQFCR